jgi:hypothetical protein
MVTGNLDTYLANTSTTVNKQVVPAGATGVLLNVTAVSPTPAGFLSIRPGSGTGVPETAGLNLRSGDVVANDITVALPTTGANAGQIDIYDDTGTISCGDGTSARLGGPAIVIDYVNLIPGATLTGCDLTGTTLDHVYWNDTTCPDGSNSGANPGVCSP